MGTKNAEANASNGQQRQQRKGTGLDRRPFSFLINASQNFRNKNPSSHCISPGELIPDYHSSFSGFPNSDGKLSYSLFGLKNRADSDFKKGWNDSGFKLSRKLKDGTTFGKTAAGTLTKKMFDTIFAQETNNRKSPVFKKNPLNCDDNFAMVTPPDVRLDDPSEPIYTDPSFFDLERSRSLRSIAVSTGNNNNNTGQNQSSKSNNDDHDDDV